MENLEEFATAGRILIVEHDASDAELCRHVLRKANRHFQIDVVASRDDYLARIRETPYDAVLSDYRMPGWSGLDALEMLRREGKDTPFLLMTGALGDEMAVECMKKGVADYVLKDRLARFLQVNDAAVAFYGFSLEEFSRLTLLDIRAEETLSNASLRQSP